MNLSNVAYMILNSIVGITIGCMLIYGIGSVMLFVSNKFKAHEWINSILAVLVIFIIFGIVALSTILIMTILPIFLCIIMISLLCSIVYYIIYNIRG